MINIRRDKYIIARPWIGSAYEIDCEECGWSAVRIGYRRTEEAVREHLNIHRETDARDPN